MSALATWAGVVSVATCAFGTMRAYFGEPDWIMYCSLGLALGSLATSVYRRSSTQQRGRHKTDQNKPGYYSGNGYQDEQGRQGRHRPDGR